MVRRSKFFDSMEQTVSLRTVIGKDTANAQEHTESFERALVSLGGQSLPANAETIPEGTARVFLKNVLPAIFSVGDRLALFDSRSAKDFIYTIQVIDTNVAGSNARRYKTRIEAKRKI